MNAKHTPGPWAAGNQQRIYGNTESGAQGIPCARAYTDDDAKIIAAAPEMAESLRRIQGYCPVVVQDRIRALLAKAGL